MKSLKILSFKRNNRFKKLNLFIKYDQKNFSNNNLIKIKYSYLTDPNNSQTFLFDAISKAYNQDGFGIMVIEKVPGILEKKKKLFELTHKLINLPENELKKIEKQELNYSIGWSYGKEYLGSKPDLLKASYYAKLDPLHSSKNFKDENIWPEMIPELKSSFTEVGNMIRDIGLIILKNIDLFIKKKNSCYNLDYQSIISDSDQNTGRMLYYFPRKKLYKNLENNDNKAFNLESSDSNWCEWHNDHGSLTGLVSASYNNEDGSEALNLNLTKTGLWIQNRKGDLIRMAYGQEDIAFQLGETLQIHSGGLLHATPHSVKFMEDAPEDVARTTFALFMQPNKHFKLNLPKEAKKDDINTNPIYKYIPKLEDRFTENITFGDFCDKTNDLYYKMNNK